MKDMKKRMGKVRKIYNHKNIGKKSFQSSKKRK